MPRTIKSLVRPTILVLGITFSAHSLIGGGIFTGLGAVLNAMLFPAGNASTPTKMSKFAVIWGLGLFSVMLILTGVGAFAVLDWIADQTHSVWLRFVGSPIIIYFVVGVITLWIKYWVVVNSKDTKNDKEA